MGSDFERYKQMYKEGLISKEELRRRKAEPAGAKGDSFTVGGRTAAEKTLRFIVFVIWGGGLGALLYFVAIKDKEITAFLGLAAILSVVSVLLLIGIDSKRDRRLLRYADQLAAEGNRKEAYDIMTKLVSDEEVLRKARGLNIYTPIEDAVPGDVVLMGRFEQESTERRAIDLEWRVLERTENRLLLLSIYVPDAVTFDRIWNEEAKWESSDVRKWMNNAFYHEAFDKNEQDMILETARENGVRDKIFALSESEVNRYLPNSVDRIAVITPWLCEKSDGMIDTADWWLCNDAEDGFVKAVDSTGEIDEIVSSDDETTGARPAIWVSAVKADQERQV